MIIQTRTVQTDIPRKCPVTGPKSVQFIDQFNCILHCCRTCKGTIVSGSVLFHDSGKKDSRKFLPDSHLDIRIGFVILEHGVVSWTVLLDQIVFQHQCFQFRIRYNIFKARNLTDHLINLRPSSHDFTEIGSDPVVQINCFADIHDGIIRIMHDIDSGLVREFFQFCLYIKLILLHVFLTKTKWPYISHVRPLLISFYF